MAEKVLTELFFKTSSIDINLRHGSVLAIGEIVHSLKLLENESEQVYLTQDRINLINGLMLKFLNRDQFRGMLF